jgi:hypothetical protein
MKNSKLLMLCLFVSVIIVSAGLVSAKQPIIAGGDPTVGFDIKFPPQFTFLDNQDTELDFHVYNATTGLPISSGIGCYLHLYSSSGDHIYEGYDDTVSHNFDYSFDINGGNFTRETTGYLIQCNNSQAGGWEEVGILVNRSGYNPDGIMISFFSFLFILVCFEMLGLLLWTILHFLEMNIDVKDLILNISSYFALFAFYILQKRFIGDVFMGDFTLFLLEAGALTAVIIPLIGFILSYFRQNLDTGDKN